MAGLWIAAATSKNKGAFRKKAEAKGESTSELATQDENKGGTLGKEARLAKTLMGMRKK